jgi:hypothetical protein
LSFLPGFMGPSVFNGPLDLSQMNFTAPLDRVPLPRDFKIPEGSTVTFSTTATGKPVVHISSLARENYPSHWATEAKEHPQVASNSKAYKVTLTSGDERTIEANEVQEANGRLTFKGSVKGHETASPYGDVVASFLSESVAEYGVVPVPEETKTGENTYRVTFKDGTTEDIQADRILASKGSDKSPGQFTFVTGVRYGENRTEYLVGEDLVHSIKRVNAAGDDVVVPTQGDSKTLSATARELPNG